jgi:hypothetical protein
VTSEGRAGPTRACRVTVLAPTGGQSLPGEGRGPGVEIRLTAARNPDTRIVIDHPGLLQSFEPPKPAEPWADLPKLVALARHDNVVVKISGADRRQG